MYIFCKEKFETCYKMQKMSEMAMFIIFSSNFQGFEIRLWEE